jgi:hypothetical protein
MGLKKSIIIKLLWLGLIIAIFYLVALIQIPDGVKDTVNWFGENFTVICFTACFLMASYVALQILKRRENK